MVGARNGVDYLEILSRFELSRPTEAWVKFHARRAAESGFRVEVRRRGDVRRGSVVIKLNDTRERAEVLTMVRTPKGTIHWIPVHGASVVTNARAERYLERLARTDPDVWILDVCRERNRLCAEPVAEDASYRATSRAGAARHTPSLR